MVEWSWERDEYDDEEEWAQGSEKGRKESETEKTAQLKSGRRPTPALRLRSPLLQLQGPMVSFPRSLIRLSQHLYLYRDSLAEFRHPLEANSRNLGNVF